MTEWTERVFYIIPIGQRTAMNARMNAPSHNKDTGDPTTWDRALELRPNNPGNGPASALGINSLVKGTERAAWEQDSIPGGTQYWESDGWTWESALSDRDLKVIAPEGP